MRFLIDANLPRSAVGLLVGFWHEVDFARDIGLASAPDEQIAIRGALLLSYVATIAAIGSTYFPFDSAALIFKTITNGKLPRRQGVVS
jgi:Domain of unknown function (DUF5615)